MKTIPIKDISQINHAAREILKALSGKKIIAFYGGLGAGKTTLIKALCRKLKAQDSATSPTFSIINEYFLPDGNKVFHFDFFRIDKIEEIYDFGYEEYFYSSHYCFIEWPEKIEELLPDSTMRIYIDIISKEERIIRLED